MRAEVLDAIKKTSTGEDGTTKAQVFQFLASSGKNIAMSDIAKFVVMMQEDGTVYGTIDEEHFMSCE